MLAENKCGGSISFVILCAIGTCGKKRKEKNSWKKKKSVKSMKKELKRCEKEFQSIVC